MNKIVHIMCTLLVPFMVQASSPQIQSYNTFNQFEKGTSNGVSISSEGELLLAPQIDKIHESEQSFIWDIISDQNGTIFFSAGNEGEIYKIATSGDVNLFCKLDEIQIHALAIDNENNLYAGSSPKGKIYKIDSGGNSEIVATFSETYIWDLIFDESNNMYVATGDSGAIYKITATGKSSLFYQSSEPHIRAMNWDQSGNLIAGSMGNGYVYKISSDGKPFILYDSELKEIHQIEVSKNGIIYAAGLGKTRPLDPIRPASKDDKDEEKTKNNDGNDEIKGVFVLDEIKIEAPAGPKALRTSSESSIFKIEPSGLIQNIWNGQKEPVQSIALKSNGILIVGTGKNGKLYAIAQNNEKTMLTGFEHAQISSLHINKLNQSVLIATANLGSVYTMNDKLRRNGTYISEVLDTYSVSKWGSLSWEYDCPKGCDIKFYTRGGNTEDANKTWSEWKGGYSDSEGSPIESLKFRFLQWKVEIKSNGKISPRIKKVNVSYAQENLSPIIYDITIHPQGEYYQNPEQNFEYDGPSYGQEMLDAKNGNSNSNHSNNYMGRKLFRKGYRTVSWQVIDDNNDDLIYDLYYRLSDNKNWKVLVRNWLPSFISWDTHRFPDGVYFLKLVASDSLSNSKNQFIRTEKRSDSFEIDNSGPKIENVKIKINNDQLIATFKVTDRFNPVKEVNYSIDGKKWERVYPEDSIFDTKTEYFTINDKFKKDGSKHSLIIKAIDLVYNLGFGQAYFEE